MLRVAILDDHPAVLAGLRRLIEAEHDMTVVAAAANPAELAKQIDGIRVDVLVLDYDLAAADGLACCRRVKSRPRAPRVVVYSQMRLQRSRWPLEPRRRTASSARPSPSLCSCPRSGESHRAKR
jgi:chemotaxis response regulator CheB